MKINTYFNKFRKQTIFRNWHLFTIKYQFKLKQQYIYQQSLRVDKETNKTKQTKPNQQTKTINCLFIDKTKMQENEQFFYDFLDSLTAALTP